MKLIAKIAIAIVLFAPAGIYLANPFGTSSYDPRARIFGIKPYRIPSSSMTPTLQSGDFILVSIGEYKTKIPDINDVIVFKYPENKNISFVMRVIARDGETVNMKNGIIKVDGNLIDQPYIGENNDIRTRKLNVSIPVPKGSLFVLGDNRDNSRDSRSWGFVPISDVVGKVTMIWMSNDMDRIGMDVK